MPYDEDHDCTLAADFYKSEAAAEDYLNQHIGPRPAQFPLDADTDSSTEHSIHNTKPLCNALPQTPGYTTHDDLGSTGDDTIHTPVPYYFVPNVIQTFVRTFSTTDEYISAVENFNASNPPLPSDDQLVDVVFNQFLAPFIIKILNVLPEVLEGDIGERNDGDGVTQVPGRRTYSYADISNYVPGETFTTLFARWVAENWKVNCKAEEMRSGHEGEL